MSSKFIFVYITCPNRAVAEKIARHTVKTKLAACANIIGRMESIYSWKGRLEKAREIVLILKARKTHFKKIESAVQTLHPYECPCIVALPVSLGTGPYLKWIEDETR